MSLARVAKGQGIARLFLGVGEMEEVAPWSAEVSEELSVLGMADSWKVTVDRTVASFMIMVWMVKCWLLDPVSTRLAR